MILLFPINYLMEEHCKIVGMDAPNWPQQLASLFEGQDRIGLTTRAAPRRLNRHLCKLQQASDEPP